MKGTELQSSILELEEVFMRFGIDTNSPGFYDGSSFLAVERSSSSFLENYAAYVQLREYQEAYIKKATIEIPFIAKIIHEELIKDGRLGACVDASIVISRILEKEGFWNYLVKGSLTIEFPEEAKLEDRYFWSVDHGEFTAAHAWVVAPPFNIIDITVKQQPFFKGEEKWLPPFMIHSDYNSCIVEDKDVISPDLRLIMKREFKGKLLPHTKENWNQFVKIFKPNLVSVDGLKLKYIPVGISAPDEPLERVGTLNLCGRRGIELYNDLILPQLSKLRKADAI